MMMKGFFARRSGFTIIELILVVVILSILAIAIFAYFYDISSKAEENQEAYVIGSVQEGIDLQHANEMVSP